MFARVFLFWMVAGVGLLTALAGLDAEAKPKDNPGGGPEKLSACQTITESGSYVLKHDLIQLAADSDCLVIAADHVTVDLAGFNISGSGGSTGDGVRIAPGPRQDIQIANGGIRGFGGDGVSGIFVGNAGFRLLRLRATGNGNDGIDVTGSGHVIADSHVAGNGNYGISAAGDTIVSGNSVSANASYGITVASGAGGATIVGNNVSGSPHGIEAGDHSIVRDNVVSESSEVGIDALGHCLVAGNTVSSRGTAIRANAGWNLVKGNVVRPIGDPDPETGVEVVGQGNAIEENLITGYADAADAAIRIHVVSANNYCQDNRLQGNGANDVVDHSGGQSPDCIAAVSY